jgi:hypothetical protein
VFVVVIAGIVWISYRAWHHQPCRRSEGILNVNVQS